MLKRLSLVAAFLSSFAFAATAQAATHTDSFGYTGGEQTFTVPEGVSSVHVVAIGGSGGAGEFGSGGQGARVTGDVPVTPGEVLYVEVGGNGHESFLLSGDGAGGVNRGGPSGSTFPGAGGGGASDVRFLARTAPTTLAARLVVAPGGGGASDGETGGAGGSDGQTDSNCPDGGGKKGTSTGGGTGGLQCG